MKRGREEIWRKTRPMRDNRKDVDRKRNEKERKKVELNNEKKNFVKTGTKETKKA